MVKIGTPGYHKGDFYKAINLNKRRARGKRLNHFEYDDRVVCKYNPYYKKFIDKEKLRLGEDSEEFQMSYRLKWMLERGMLITEDDLDILADKSMPWSRRGTAPPSSSASTRPGSRTPPSSPSAGWTGTTPIPPATGSTASSTGWRSTTPTGRSSTSKSWTSWSRTGISHVGVDAQGMGSAVADRMRRLLGSRCEVIPYSATPRTRASAGST